MDKAVVNQLVILFLLMIAGFVLSKAGLLDKAGSDKLSSFISRVSMPAMYLATFFGQDFSTDKLADAGLLLGLSFAIYILAFGFGFGFVKATRTPRASAGVYQFLLLFSNAAYMGFPVLRAILGEEAVFYGAFFNIPFNILAYSIGIWLLRRGKEGVAVRPRDMFLNPGTLAVVTGALFFVASPLWSGSAVFEVFHSGPVYQALDLVGDTTVPLSMLVIGCVLATVRPGAIFRNWRVMLVCLCRLLVLPGIVRLALAPFHLSPMLLGIPVLVTGMPCAVFSVILSKEYGGDEKTASVGVFLSTLLSSVTIPLLALWV